MTLFDGLSARAVFSFSRKLIDAYGGSFYTDTSGKVSELFDQTGNGRSFTQSTSAERPLVATAGPLSRACGDFVVADECSLVSAVNASVLVSAGVGYAIASFIPRDITKVTTASAHSIFGQGAARMGATVSTVDGRPYTATSYVYDGAYKYAQVTDAVVEDEAYVIEWRLESGTVYCRINGGSWGSIATGNATQLNLDTMRIGRSHPNGHFDGHIFEVAFFQYVPDSTTRDALVADMLNWVAPKSSVDITVSGAASTLTDFVVHLPLNRVAALDAGFWSEVRSNGGDIRAFEGATALAVDVCYIDVGEEEGHVYIKIPSLTTAGTTITIEWDGNLTMPPPDSLIGAYNVWTAFLIFVDFWGGAINRKGGTSLTSRSTPGGIVDGWWQASDAGHYTSAVGSSIDRTWTVGAHFLCSDVDGTEQVVVAGAASLSANGRFTVGLNPTGDEISVWNDTDLYLSTSVAAVEDQSYYLTSTQDSSSDVRALFIDGVEYDSAITVDRALDHFCIGGRSYSTSSVGRLNGAIQYAWGTLVVLSDDWIGHEYLNRTDPDAFFASDEFTSTLTLDYELEEAAFESAITFDYALEEAGFESSVTLDYRLRNNPISSDLELDYKLLDFFETYLTLDYALEDVVEARVTQLPVLAVYLTEQSASITQLPLLVVALPEQDTAITQLPQMPVVFERPVPFPTAMVPIAPVAETWSFWTIVNKSEGAREQRSGLRGEPRFRMSYEVRSINEAQRRGLFALMFKSQGMVFQFPMFHAFARLTAAASPTDVDVYFDPAHTDLRDGDYLAIWDVFTMQVTYHEIDTIESDGVTLTAPVGRWLGPGHVVSPAVQCRVINRVNLDYAEKLGAARFVLETVGSRTLERVDGSSLLTIYDGLPVLDRQPHGPMNDGLDRGYEWQDDGTSIPLATTRWGQGFIDGSRSFKLDRFTDMDYWRAMISRLSGKRVSFLIPSWTNDLPLIEVPALGSRQLVTDEIQADDVMKGQSFKYVEIHRQTGVIYRKIAGHRLLYDANGDPVAVRLTLNASIGNNAGDNVISRVSYAYKVRLDNDDVTFNHDVGFTTVELEIQAVDR